LVLLLFEEKEVEKVAFTGSNIRPESELLKQKWITCLADWPTFARP